MLKYTIPYNKYSLLSLCQLDGSDVTGTCISKEYVIHNNGDRKLLTKVRQCDSGEQVCFAQIVLRHNSLVYHLLMTFYMEISKHRPMQQMSNAGKGCQ